MNDEKPDTTTYHELRYSQVHLGNHAYGYECRICYALSASELAAKYHQEWHVKLDKRIWLAGT